MINVCLFLSYFVFLILFFIFTVMRMNLVATILIYILILFPNTVPLIVIFIEQSKVEKKKAKSFEHTDGN